MVRLNAASDSGSVQRLSPTGPPKSSSEYDTANSDIRRATAVHCISPADPSAGSPADEACHSTRGTDSAPVCVLQLAGVRATGPRARPGKACAVAGSASLAPCATAAGAPELCSRSQRPRSKAQPGRASAAAEH